LDIIKLSGLKNIDLRSEREFQKGTIPGSVNIPILSNDEFEKVGKEYKNKGQEAAIALGLILVKDELREKRISSWKNHIIKNPDCNIFCYRGGLRSQIALEWLESENINIKRLSGGYKKFRAIIINEHMDINNYEKNWIIVGGLTGSGKTALINQSNQKIDLEKIANHRGSAFGKNKSAQPAQANFENMLTIKYLNHQYPNIVLEDESRTIGRAGLPGFWYEKMQVSKLVVLKISTEQRIKNILEEYVIRELNNSHKLLDRYLTALEKIKKRLGDMLFKEISGLMISGFNNNDITSHEDWVLKLLTKYYDPMYNYKLESRSDYIVHIGDNISCLKYLKSI